MFREAYINSGTKIHRIRQVQPLGVGEGEVCPVEAYINSGIRYIELDSLYRCWGRSF